MLPGPTWPGDQMSSRLKSYECQFPRSSMRSRRRPFMSALLTALKPMPGSAVAGSLRAHCRLIQELAGAGLARRDYDLTTPRTARLAHRERPPPDTGAGRRRGHRVTHGHRRAVADCGRPPPRHRRHDPRRGRGGGRPSTSPERRKSRTGQHPQGCDPVPCRIHLSGPRINRVDVMSLSAARTTPQLPARPRAFITTCRDAQPHRGRRSAERNLRRNVRRRKAAWRATSRLTRTPLPDVATASNAVFTSSMAAVSSPNRRRIRS